MVKAKKIGRPKLYDERVTIRLDERGSASVSRAQEILEAHSLPSGKSDAVRWILTTWREP